MIRIDQKLIVVRSKEEAEKHGYTGWRNDEYCCGIFVDEDTEMCDYRRFRDLTAFSIKRVNDCKSLVFYELDKRLGMFLYDNLIVLKDIVF